MFTGFLSAFLTSKKTASRFCMGGFGGLVRGGAVVSHRLHSWAQRLRPGAGCSGAIFYWAGMKGRPNGGGRFMTAIDGGQDIQCTGVKARIKNEPRRRGGRGGYFSGECELLAAGGDCAWGGLAVEGRR